MTGKDDMATRPNFIDFRSKSHDVMLSGLPSPGRLPSPRIAHIDGDIPPQMSPLDMFAAQSRMLAKKLDDSKRNDRRVSRLPPLAIADSFSRTASAYHRSRSAETQGAGSPSNSRSRGDDAATGNIPGVQEPAFRPKSFYPRMSRIRSEDDGDDGDNDEGGTHEKDDSHSLGDQDLLTPATSQPRLANDYFTSQRVASPESVTSQGDVGSRTKNQTLVGPQRNVDSSRHRAEPLKGVSGGYISVEGPKSTALAPPQSPHLRQTASIKSVPMDSSDDELSASTHGSSFSQHRKQSSSSGMSAPHSPFSPYAQLHARSPSLNSEYSIGGSKLARPTFNFSRPLSRGSQPSLDLSSRQPSFDDRPSFDIGSRQPSSDSQRFLFVDGHKAPQAAMENEQYFDSKDSTDAPAPSYIYTKFSLPRGRILQRDSRVLENQQMPRFEWEQPSLQSNVTPVTPPSDDRPSSSSMSPPQAGRPSAEFSKPSPRPSMEKSPLGPNRRPPPPTSNDSQSTSASSMRSGSTIKARPNRPMSPSVDVTAEDHLARGIESHERGNLKESTYHLRIAARHNLPTAMLLYALACRHGWGMRPNPQEGVQWLRKAADSASLEIADDEDQQKEGGPRDIQQEKARRAQFALSIYELGVSHMNGWGIEQDKALALRCFEIAANWGDADAMAEAGFCYTQGSGCKKDLMKAAKYYRMAEAKGMSMVGNSWCGFLKMDDVEIWQLANFD